MMNILNYYLDNALLLSDYYNKSNNYFKNENNNKPSK